MVVAIKRRFCSQNLLSTGLFFGKEICDRWLFSFHFEVDPELEWQRQLQFRQYLFIHYYFVRNPKYTKNYFIIHKDYQINNIIECQIGKKLQPDSTG